MKSRATFRYRKNWHKQSLGLMIALVLLAAVVVPAQQRNNQKVIRDPIEYAAYTSAVNTRDPAQRAAALETFVRNYPDSVAKIDALEHAMAAYQQSGNSAKLEETAKRVLALQPNSVRALAIITYLGRTNNQDHYEEVCADAQKGLQEMPRWQATEGMPEAESHKLQAQMAAIFYGALGFCALQKKDYASARESYLKALQINPNNMSDSYQLGITDLEMNPLDPAGFWYIAKAMNLAQAQGNNAASEGMESYAKPKYRSYHGSEDGWDELIKEAGTKTAPPVDGTKIQKALTPPELAVKAVQDNDPQSLSFSDWEFILQYRDASPANKDAADKVWQAIQSLQRNGKVKLKIPVKVIAATKDMIHAAITDDNQSANKADLQVAMARPLSHPPGGGAMVDVIGVMTSYRSQPFLFNMGNGEIAADNPPAHTQLSAADIERLLQGGVTPKRVTELVKERGVDFTLDDSTEAQLRKAGATDELLLAIAKGKQ